MARQSTKAAARSESRREAPSRHAGPASPLEWVVGAIGLVLVVATVGYLIYAALTAAEGPPQIRLEAGAVQPSGAGHVVVVTASNDGPMTAVALEIQGTLRDDDGAAVETSTARMDYLPRLSERTVGLLFNQDPTRYRIELRALGYAEP